MVTQLISATLISTGFALIFGLRKRFVFFTAAGGLLCWSVYLLAKYFSFGEFSASFVSTLAVGIFCEVLARVLKAPTTIFFTPSIIPLVPGRALFYAISCAVGGDFTNAREFALETGAVAAAIAVGLGVAVSVFSTATRIKKYNK